MRSQRAGHDLATEQVRQILYDIPYMWNLKLKKKINLFTKQRLTVKGNKLMIIKGERGEAG